MSPQKYIDLPITDNDENPGTSYDNLRKLIHTIIQEVLALPEIYSQIGGSVNNLNANQVATPFEPKKYEDLLATAVLNKVRLLISTRFKKKNVYQRN